MAWWIKAIPTGWLSNYLDKREIGPFDTEDEAYEGINDYLNDFHLDRNGIDDDDMDKEEDEMEHLVEWELWDDEDKEGTISYPTLD